MSESASQISQSSTYRKLVTRDAQAALRPAEEQQAAMGAREMTATARLAELAESAGFKVPTNPQGQRSKPSGSAPSFPMTDLTQARRTIAVQGNSDHGASKTKQRPNLSNPASS